MDGRSPRNQRGCRLVIVFWIAAVCGLVVLGSIQAKRMFPKPLSVTGDCPAFRTVKEYAELSNITFGRQANGGDYYVSGLVNFTRMSHKWDKVHMNITMCPGPTEVNKKCLFFGHWVFDTNVCRMVKARNMLWTKVFDALTPEFPVSCKPFGLYHINRATIDFHLLEALRPPKGKLWKVDTLTWDESKVPVFFAGFTGMLLYE